MATFYKHFALVYTVFCVVFSCGAFAQDEIYTVENVEVDVTADNAVQAREKAMEEAQVKAYQMLAEKLLPPEEFEVFEMPDSATISSLIQDFEVTNEQLSAVRYKGVFTVRFRPGAMRSRLAAGGTSYVEDVAREASLLVLPFYQYGSRMTLWEPSNEWMKAWVRPQEDEAGSLTIVPMGDLLDVSQVRDDQALTYAPEMMKRMMGRYDAEEAAILIATPKETGTAGAGDEALSLDIRMYEAGESGPEYMRSVSLDSLPEEDRQAFYDRSVREVRSLLRGNWKQKRVITPAQIQFFQARVHFASVQEWVKAKNILDRLPGMQTILIKGLKPKQAEVQLQYAGDEDHLRQALQRAGIAMQAGYGQQAGYVSGYGNGVADSLVYDLSMGRRPY